MRLVLACLVLAAAPLAAQKPTTDAEFQRRGHDLTRWILAGKADSAAPYLSPTLLKAMGGPEGLRQAASDLAGDLGHETTVHMENVTRARGLVEYWRMSSFSEVIDEPYVFHWVFDADGIAQGIGLTPLSGTPEPQE